MCAMVMAMAMLMEMAVFCDPATGAVLRALVDGMESMEVVVDPEAILQRRWRVHHAVSVQVQV